MLVTKFASLAVPSSGIHRIPDISLFLHELTDSVVWQPRQNNKAEAVAGWGFKKSAKKARNFAAKNKLPYIALEDGFFRSVGLGVDGARPLSLVIDDKGIFYSALQESRLEWGLNGGIDISAVDRVRARSLMAFIRDHRLTKYNIHTTTEIPWFDKLGSDNLLIVDQTWGDASLDGSLAKKESFGEMISHALKTRSASKIIIKTHPDVISGRRKGCIDLSSVPDGVHLLGENVCPWDIFDKVDEVFTVSSQLGFEALIAGLKVHCFGVPFYAGWGLTSDVISAPRPRRQLSLEELVFCTLVWYPTYINPFRQCVCEVEETLEILAELRERTRDLHAPKICTGISKWKHEALAVFVGTSSKNWFIDESGKAFSKAEENGLPVFAWASKIDNSVAERCKSRNIPLVRIEDGFIRSIGLGVTLMPACSLVFDADGIYYDGRSPSGLENILNAGNFDKYDLERAASLRETIIKNRITKYNIDSNQPNFKLPTNGPIILVAGQVEDDASIICSAPVIKTNLALLQHVRGNNPEAFIIFKPHPDVLTGLRKGIIDAERAAQLADRVETANSSDNLIMVSDEIHTLTSLLGFEALIRGKKVFTYGMPFYAGWGLTEDLCPLPRRVRKLSLDQLVAGTLIKYPHYADPVSGLLCTPEQVVARLSENITFRSQRGWREKLRRLYNSSIIPRLLIRMN